MTIVLMMSEDDGSGDVESSQDKGEMTLWLVSVERSQRHGSLKKEWNSIYMSGT